jgi:hypothetical protein
VNWPNDGQNFWDTHGNNFKSLKTRLMPPADAGFSALLDDLSERGMLDETLVLWVGEFGRTPKINPANAGRDQRVAARAGAAVVRAGLERDVRRRALDRAALRRGVAQRHHLGMRAAGLLRVALAQHAAFSVAQHAAHARVRIGQQQRRRGQPQCGGDVQGVLFLRGHVGFGGRSWQRCRWIIRAAFERGRTVRAAMPVPA